MRNSLLQDGTLSEGLLQHPPTPLVLCGAFQLLVGINPSAFDFNGLIKVQLGICVLPQQPKYLSAVVEQASPVGVLLQAS